MTDAPLFSPDPPSQPPVLGEIRTATYHVACLRCGTVHQSPDCAAAIAASDTCCEAL